MKYHLLLLICLVLVCAPSQASAQTLNWGSAIFSDLVDSNGDTLNENEVLFQLGNFDFGFTPTSENTSEWSARWNVFDQAAYNQSLGYFTSSVTMNDDGTSSYNPGAGQSFEGMTAYLWIFNSPTLDTSTEWFLGTSSSWVIPTAEPGCCDNETIVEWSMSDLDVGDAPVWGNQGGTLGAGYYTTTGGYTLQTFTVIPEPSAAFLMVMSSLTLLQRNRRKL